MNELLNILRRHPNWSVMVWAQAAHGQQAAGAVNITIRAQIAGREQRLDKSIDKWDLEQPGFMDAHISDTLQDMERAMSAREATGQ